MVPVHWFNRNKKNEQALWYTYKRQCDLKRCHLNCIFNTILKTSGVPRTPLLAVGGPQMDSGPSHNVRGPVSISGHERATSRVLAFGGHKWTQNFLIMLSPESTRGHGRATSGLRTFSQCQGSWVHSWLWEGHKWTQDLLTTSSSQSSCECGRAST